MIVNIHNLPAAKQTLPSFSNYKNKDTEDKTEKESSAQVQH